MSADGKASHHFTTRSLHIELLSRRWLQFGDGSPVTAASAMTPFGDGWLIVQDDANHGAWVRPDRPTVALRLLSPTAGLDRFTVDAGNKHLKGDLEAACAVVLPSGETAALLLGSGSTAQRMRGVLVGLVGGEPVAVEADLSSLYEQVSATLGISTEALNLEGAAVLGDEMLWFNRGNADLGVESQCVALNLPELLAQWPTPVPTLRLGERYDFGHGMHVTDAVAIGDGLLLLSAAAEDTPNAYDDGPVGASALALADVSGVLAVGHFPLLDGVPHKVEGLASQSVGQGHATVIAVVDKDSAHEPSLELTLSVRW